MTISGPIATSDADSVTVGDLRVPRSQIEDIDHPGNVALALGILAAGFGGMMMLAAAAPCDGFGCGLGRAYGLGLGVPMLGVGIPTAIYGGRAWARSRDRAGERPAQPERPVRDPWLSMPPGTGATYSMRW